MLKDNLKTLRKQKGLSQEELSIKLHVVRQTISKWEQGLSVPDAEMLINISELFETPVSDILGENIEIKEKNDLKVISEKLEVINEQLSNYQKEKRKKRIKTFIIISIGTLLLFILFAILDRPYEKWDYTITEWAILGTFYQAFEWIFMRVAPFIVVGSIIGICINIKKQN